MNFPSNTPDNKDTTPLVLLDGGSHVNVITKSYAAKLKQIFRTEFASLKWKGKIKPVGSKALTDHGVIGIPFTRRNGEKLLIPFVVIDDVIEYNMIFGLNIMEKLEVQLNYSSGEVLLGPQISITPKSLYSTH